VVETGRVRGLEGNLAAVAPDRSAACFGCMNHECKSGGGFISAENPLGLPLQTGQLVEVQAPPGMSIFGQALAALLPPFLGFATGYVLARLLLPGAGEGAAAGIGVLVLFAAAFIIYRVKKKHPSGKMYTVTKIIS